MVEEPQREPCSAALPVDVAALTLAFAFVFHDCDELPRAQDRKPDSGHPCICDNGSIHILSSHSGEQGISDPYILLYASKDASSLHSAGSPDSDRPRVDTSQRV